MRTQTNIRYIFSRKVYSGRCLHCDWHDEAATLTEIIDLAEDHMCPRYKRKRRKHKLTEKEGTILDQFYRQVHVEE